MDRTIVVGGGLGGLAVATWLGRAGQRVLVLEAGSELGGRARTQDRGGYLCNLGPHALYLRGEAARALADLGVAAPGGVPGQRQPLALVGERVRRLPVGLGSLLATGLLGWGAKLELAGFLGRLPRLDVGGLRGSVGAWLEAELRHPESRALVAALIRLSTYVDDAGLPAALGLGQLQLASRGVRYVDGGWATLVEGLADAAQAAGVAVRTSTPVEGLREREGRVDGVVVRGDVLPARSVVLAVGPEQASRLTGRALRRSPRPSQVSCLDVALRRLPGRSEFLLGIDAPLYASVHSVAAALAPNGGALVQLYRGGSAFEAPEVAEAELERCLDALQPGWRAEEVDRRFLPRMVVAHDVPTARDEPPLLEPPPGVALVGDWLRTPGWLLDASLSSARQVAERLTRSGVARAA